MGEYLYYKIFNNRYSYYINNHKIHISNHFYAFFDLFFKKNFLLLLDTLKYPAGFMTLLLLTRAAFCRRRSSHIITMMSWLCILRAESPPFICHPPYLLRTLELKKAKGNYRPPTFRPPYTMEFLISDSNQQFLHVLRPERKHAGRRRTKIQPDGCYTLHFSSPRRQNVISYQIYVASEKNY